MIAIAKLLLLYDRATRSPNTIMDQTSMIAIAKYDQTSMIAIAKYDRISYMCDRRIRSDIYDRDR